MPLYMPVPDLLFITVVKTAGILTDALRSGSAEFADKNDVVMETMQLYLSEVPVHVRERVLHFILEFEDDDAVRYKILKIMLCPQIKTLRTYIFPEFCFESIAQVIASQGSNLVCLDLRGVWLKGDLNVELQKILLNLKFVEVLHIPHVATDSALQAIGQANPPLQFLDMRGDCKISTLGIQQLCNCSCKNIVQNLKVVLLGSPSGIELSPQIVELLIEYLPNLQSLGSNGNVRQAIALLVKNERVVKTNLTNIRDSCTDLESINLLIQTCPKLKYIYLEHPFENVIPQLVYFSELSKIKLCKFQISDLYAFIEKGGKRLLSMELILGDRTLDISYLMKFCSNLETLKCFKINYLRHFGPFELNKLKDVEICYSNITASCVKEIILASLNLENLSFGGLLEITDQDIIEIFTVNEYSKLKSIWLPNAKELTPRSIQVIMSCCPNLLTLGIVSNWNVTEEEINIIQKAIQSKNLALKLIDYFVAQ